LITKINMISSKEGDCMRKCVSCNQSYSFIDYYFRGFHKGMICKKCDVSCKGRVLPLVVVYLLTSIISFIILIYFSSGYLMHFTIVFLCFFVSSFLQYLFIPIKNGI